MSLTELLRDIARTPDILRRATAMVEYEHLPDRIRYRITGDSFDVVQSAIDNRMREVEERGGLAVFDLPRRKNGEFEAKGEVFV